MTQEVLWFVIGLATIAWIIANVAIKSFYLDALKANQTLFLAEKEIDRLNRVARSQQDWIDDHECCEERYVEEEEEEDDEEESLDPERN